MMSPARAKTRPFSTKRSRAYSSLINASILTLVVISAMQGWLDQQVAMISAVQKWQADSG